MAKQNLSKNLNEEAGNKTKQVPFNKTANTEQTKTAEVSSKRSLPVAKKRDPKTKHINLLVTETLNDAVEKAYKAQGFKSKNAFVEAILLDVLGISHQG